MEDDNIRKGPLKILQDDRYRSGVATTVKREKEKGKKVSVFICMHYANIDLDSSNQTNECCQEPVRIRGVDMVGDSKYGLTSTGEQIKAAVVKLKGYLTLVESLIVNNTPERLPVWRRTDI
jgi:hypothetical protein